MVKLKSIRLKNNIIECDILPEDSSQSGHIQVDTKSGKVIKYVLPVGYEWCRSHVEHAKDKLLEMHQKNTIEEEATVMWY